MSRLEALRQFGEMLQLEAVGAWLDTISDADARDLTLKLAGRLRELRDDMVVAEAMETIE